MAATTLKVGKGVAFHDQGFTNTRAYMLLAMLQVALEQGTISLSVATELFKAARLSKAESTKDATLANTPCTQTEDDYTFSVANYNESVTDSARERYLGLTNRVIAGMLLHTTRTTPVNCTDSRFSDIESLCKGGEAFTCSH